MPAPTRDPGSAARHNPVGQPPAGGGKNYSNTDLYDPVGTVFGKNVKMAIAIVLAESGGNSHARNVNTDGSVDRGLFQINNVAHPDVSDACAYDPACNIRAAYRISKGGTDWGPWSTYHNGAYKQYLKGSNLPNADDAGPFGIGRGQGADTTATQTFNSVGDFLNPLGVIFSAQFWLRVGMILGGLILVGIGIVMAARSYTFGQAGKAITGKLRPSYT